MPHWRSYTDREYIYAYDLGGQDRTLTIERVLGAVVTGDKGKKSKKPILFFKETKIDPETQKKKGLVLNATNGKCIAALYGNETDNWVGKRVTLYPTTTESGGETVDCIRIRRQVPAQARQQTRNSKGLPSTPGLPEDGIVTRRPDLPEESAAEQPYDGPPDDVPLAGDEPREPGADG